MQRPTRPAANRMTCRHKTHCNKSKVQSLCLRVCSCSAGEEIIHGISDYFGGEYGLFSCVDWWMFSDVS